MSDWDSTWGQEFSCSVCGNKQIVLPSGPEDSHILIIESHPDEDDIKQQRPLAGPRGSVLSNELRRNGFNLSAIRICSMWRHDPPSKKDTNYEQCFMEGIELCIKEAKNKDIVLLLGSEAVKFFCDASVSDTSGLKITSNYLSNPVIMSSIQPTIVFKQGGVGEFRLSIKKFCDEMEKLENDR